MPDDPMPSGCDTRSMALSGEIDIAVVGDLLDEARRCLATSPPVLAIDLGEVTFIDSSGLGALVQVRNLAGEQGVSVVILRLPPRIRRLLEVSGLDGVFEVRSGD